VRCLAGNVERELRGYVFGGYESEFFNEAGVNAARADDEAGDIFAKGKGVSIQLLGW